VVLRYDVNEAQALRDAAEQVLRGETTYSIVGEWKQGDIRPPIAEHWSYATLAAVLCLPRAAGLREWQGNKWRAIFDIDTREGLAKLMDDRSRLSRDREEATPAAQASIGDLDRTECHWGWLPWL
jgi:hypothetical protein